MAIKRIKEFPPRLMLRIEKESRGHDYLEIHESIEDLLAYHNQKIAIYELKEIKTIKVALPELK